MARPLLILFLILGQFPGAAATRRRAVQFPVLPVAPPAVVAAAHQAANAALKAGVPAVEIAVSHGGKVIYSEAFGFTDKESAIAATPRSVMQIGSVTKQFTSAAILRLAERGALKLDDRIEKYVPEFDPRGATITLRHLLSHTSGIHRDWYPPTLDPSLPATRQQVIKAINGLPYDFAPGQNWSYSNAGYMLLGYAIESITGQSYADFVREEFALPLGLIDTGVCGTSNLLAPEGYGRFITPSGELWARMREWHSSFTLSGGSLCSTASDLAHWSQLLATGHVMLPDSYATMTTPTQLASKALPPTLYGLGLGVQKVLGRPAVSHNGGLDGYQSYLVYFADKDVAVAVIANAYPSVAAGDPEVIALPVANAALNNAAMLELPSR